MADGVDSRPVLRVRLAPRLDWSGHKFFWIFAEIEIELF